MALPSDTTRQPDKDFGEFTFDLWRKLDSKYHSYVDRWRRSLDFLRNEHWRALQQFDEESLPDWREFPSINLTLAFYNDYLTEFLQSDVRYSAIPASPDPSDIASAELSEQLLKYGWDKMNMDRKRIDLAAWQISTGTGVLRYYWDTNTGDMLPLGIPTPGGGIMPVDPETMEPDPTRSEPAMVDKGEIGCEVVSPQFVRWAPSDSEGVMVGLLLSYDEAESMYGREAAESLSYNTDHTGLSTELINLQDPGAISSDVKRALVVEHYIPPSSKHPNGLWWTAADGGQRMLTGPWELPAGVIPIVPFRWVPIPGEKHLGMSPLYDLTFSNKIYDKLLARILEWQKKVVPKLLLKQGGGLTHGDINDEPFQTLKINPNGQPEVMDTAEPPGSFYESAQQAKRDMAFVSGQQFEEGKQRDEGSALNRFRTSSGQESGQKAALAHISSKPAWEEAGKVFLHYVREFYNEERVIGIQGPDHHYQWVEFTGKDLGNLEATIKVDELPLFPWNRQEMRDNVAAILNSKAGQVLFADEQGNIDQERVEQAMDAVGLNRSIDTLDPDTVEARNEQVEFRNLKQGQQPPQVQDYQNHQAHHEEHTNTMKSMRFKSWAPHQKQAFKQHVQQHEEIINNRAEQRQQQMIDQERQLRQVREQAELKSDILQEFASNVIQMIANRTELSLQELAEGVEGISEVTDQMDTQGETTQQGGNE